MGVDYINFKDNKRLIQPKFMENKGSMCVTELWPENMKSELINIYQNNKVKN